MGKKKTIDEQKMKDKQMNKLEGGDRRSGKR